MTNLPRARHSHAHAFDALHPREREGLVLFNRRNMLKAGLAGLAGLSLPGLLRQRAFAAESKKPSPDRKSVILLWMAGGPSHIDTWDPKPTRPLQNRGPFGVINTKVPGVVVCEHLPKMAAMMDRFTLIRSVDARGSNHEPNTVFQTGNTAAEARANREAPPALAQGSPLIVTTIRRCRRTSFSSFNAATAWCRGDRRGGRDAGG